VEALADEILIVDTGSTDRTVEIALSHGARVDSFVWCNDFSAARNAGLEQARGDWILILDADEELSPEDHEVLLEALRGDSNHLLLRLRCIQELEGRQYQGYVPRLFRNAPGIWFQDPIHESVTHTVGVLSRIWSMETGLSCARLIHHGNTPEIIQERGKVGRNHALLLRAVSDNPGNAYMQMQLGCEYLRMDRSDKAFHHFGLAVELCEGAGGLFPDSVEALLTQYASQLVQERRFEETERLLTGRLANQSPLTPWHRYLRGRARMELGRLEEALEDLQDCRSRRSEETLWITPGDLETPELEFMIGEVLGRLGRYEESERFLRWALAKDRACVRYIGATARMIARRGDPVGALGLLLEHLPEASNSVDLWILGAQIAMNAPGLESFSTEWTRDALGHHPSDTTLQLLCGAALIQAGMIREAHRLFDGLPDVREPRALGGLLFTGISCGDVRLPDLGPQEQRIAILSVVGILQQLRSRGRDDLVAGFRRAVGAYAVQYSWIADAFRDPPSGVVPDQKPEV
jgi:tetratricopeptide (TPR) repeat protein